MSYDVKVIADSISMAGRRITTLQLRYPRFIHAEFMTHRQFSRNASSTRAIPLAKQIEMVEQDPAMPVHWGKNRKGMQASSRLDPVASEQAEIDWAVARDYAVARARSLLELGVHKQIAGRILEPFAHINVIVTATSFDNFFALRCHPDAQPEMQALAVRMARAVRDSVPVIRDAGKWHLPYVGDDDRAAHDWCEEGRQRLLSCSVARCARVSYLRHDGTDPDPDHDHQLRTDLEFDRHWSPFEHQAQAMSHHDKNVRSGNFVGWKQYRQTLMPEVPPKFDYAILDRYEARDFLTPSGPTGDSP